jgi:hypothetical protein
LSELKTLPGLPDGYCSSPVEAKSNNVEGDSPMEHSSRMQMSKLAFTMDIRDVKEDESAGEDP